MAQNFDFSFFNAPVTNKTPTRTVNLIQVAQAVKSTWLEPQTTALRLITDEAQRRAYKGRNFPYITPAGTFRYCNDQSIISFSGTLCMDLDHIDDVNGLKWRLINDSLFETLMAFRSPSGDGLKWFLKIDLTKCGYRQWFEAVRNYLMSPAYGLTAKQADPCTRNESRACFLCYDPEVYVNPSILTDNR